MIINKILVTGAADYIGGSFTYEVLKKGFEVHGIENFINLISHNKNIIEMSKNSREYITKNFSYDILNSQEIHM